MSNDIKYLSGRVIKTPPTEVPADRYQWLKLNDTEPDLGVPSVSGYILQSDDIGIRSWVSPSTYIGTTSISLGRTSAPLTLSGVSIIGNALTANTANNVVTNANLTGPITSVGNATTIASKTGTGTKFVMDTSPTLITPILGVATATSLVTSGDITVGGNLTVNGATTITAQTGSGTIVVMDTSPTLIMPILGVATATSISTTGDITIGGNLTVNGSTTTINSTTLSVDDINIELGKVNTPTDTTASGGGIVLKGLTDKTIIWDNTNTNWTSSENWNLSSGKTFKINNVTVLSANTLGSGVSVAWTQIAGRPTAISGYSGYSGISGYSGSGISGYSGISGFSGLLAVSPSTSGNILVSNGSVWTSTPLTSTQVTSALTYTPYNNTNPAGYITGITSGNVVTALGFTPYNATNPSGYTTNVGTVTSVSGTAPISVATGTSTPAISMAAATASVNGYMTSTYASKLDGIAAGATNNIGTVTSVGGTGTVSGITLTGTVTGSGNLTLGGTIGTLNQNTTGSSASCTGTAANATTAGGLVIATGRNNVANQIVRTDGSGYLQTGYINSSNGNENNNANADRVWGTNGSDDYLRTYRTSALSVSYAATAGSATPTSHAHGNVTNAGYIGTTATLPIITGTAGILQAGSFGTGVGTFCQGNDSRLADTRNTTNALTINNGGAGSASGSTFNGSGAITISYNSIGASPLAGSSSLTTTGTVTSGTWSGSFGAVSGANLTTLNATNLSSGTVATAMLGTGTASSSTYLRGDQTWATISAGATLSDDTSTNRTQYIGMATASTGSWTSAYVATTKLYFNPSTGTLSSTIFNSLSDISKKKDVSVISNALGIVTSLEGVTFNWKDNGQKSSGVIAQELEKVLPFLVTEAEGVKSVNYNGLIGYLIEAVKELKAEVEKLKG